MKWFVGFLLCCAEITHAQVQDTTRFSNNSISLTQGFYYVVNKDTYRSPFTYHGVLTQVNMNYRHTGIKSMHNIWACYISGSVQTSFSPLAPSRITELSYDWQFNIHNTPKLSIYVGPSVNVYGWKADYFPEIQTTKINSWYVGINAGIASSITYRLNERNIFNLQTSLPLAGYTDRPHLMNGTTNTSIGFFTTWNPHARFIWEHKFSKAFSLLLQYDYTYLHTDVTREMNMMNNGFSLGFKFTFGKRSK